MIPEGFMQLYSQKHIDQRFALPRNNEAGEQYEDQIENL
jgi:hypothetical protein